jgi:hypothetical protein
MALDLDKVISGEALFSDLLVKQPGVKELHPKSVLSLPVAGEEMMFDFIDYDPIHGLQISTTLSLPKTVNINGYNLFEVTRQNLLIHDINRALKHTFFLTFEAPDNKRYDFFIIYIDGRVFICDLETYSEHVLGVIQQQQRSGHPDALDMLGYYSVTLAAYAKLQAQDIARLRLTNTEQTIQSEDETRPLLPESEGSLIREERILSHRKTTHRGIIEKAMRAELSPHMPDGPTKEEELKGRISALLLQRNWAFLPRNEELVLPRVSEDRTIIIGSSPLAIAKEGWTKKGVISLLTELELCPVHFSILFEHGDIVLTPNSQRRVRSRIDIGVDKPNTTRYIVQCDKPAVDLLVEVTESDKSYTIKLTDLTPAIKTES